MPLIQRSERSSHWYTRSGESCHTVIAKTTGLPRATNLTDARKLNLIPSVTNILSMKSKPALDIWKLDKAILAASQNPQKEGEPYDVWVSRIAELSEEETRTAADWGTAIHEQVECFNLNQAFDGKGEILDYVAGYEKWYRENVVKVIDAEKSIVSSVGYAGRLDLHAIIRHEGRERRAVLDIKSQKLKGKATGNFYKEWAMQLSAYAEPLMEPGEEPPLIVSLLIPSDRPGDVQPHVWDNYEAAYKAFLACFELWVFDRGYRP